MTGAVEFIFLAVFVVGCLVGISAIINARLGKKYKDELVPEIAQPHEEVQVAESTAESESDFGIFIETLGEQTKLLIEVLNHRAAENLKLQDRILKELVAIRQGLTSQSERQNEQLVALFSTLQNSLERIASARGERQAER